jgi:hypothetical protein
MVHPMHRAQSLALPLVATIRFDALDLVRRMIVLGCAAALILAGQSLPF